jgi:RHS repeat-associated protein
VAGGLPLLLQDRFASYVYGPDGQILEQVQGSTATYYHTDHLGSVRALTDQSKAVVATYSYDAYGQPTASTGSVANPFRYAGQYRDAESGLYYLRARYYAPATQQFLRRDPLVAATEQAYAYAGGSPLNATDPSGEMVFGVCGQLGAAFFFGGEAGVCFEINDQGLWQWQMPKSTGWTGGLSVGAGWTLTANISDAARASDLLGSSSGVSGVLPLRTGVAYGLAKSGPYRVRSLEWGGGPGVDLFHISQTHTVAIPVTSSPNVKPLPTRGFAPYEPPPATPPWLDNGRSNWPYWPIPSTPNAIP